MNIPLLLTWRQRVQSIPYNDVPGVTIAGVNPLYEIALLHHLTAVENEGARGVYVDVIDGVGQLQSSEALTDLRIGWTWDGRRADEPAPPYMLDKPANEPAGNIPLFMDARVAVWLQTADGRVISERVQWLSSKIEDGPSGNTLGHNSFYLIFRKRTLSHQPADHSTHVTLTERVTVLEADVAKLKKLAGVKP